MPDRNDRVLMSVGGVMKAIDRHNFVNGFLDDYATLDNGKVPDDISAPPSSAPASSPVNRNDCVLMVIGGRQQPVDRAGFVAFLNDTADQDDGTPAGTLVLPPTAQPAGSYLVDRNCKVAMSSGGGMMLVDRATFMHFLNDNLAQDDGTPAATIALPSVACLYPLDDDGTVAHSFGFGFMQADAPLYQTGSYTQTGAPPADATPPNIGAISAPANALSTAQIAMPATGGIAAQLKFTAWPADINALVPSKGLVAAIFNSSGALVGITGVYLLQSSGQLAYRTTNMAGSSSSATIGAVSAAGMSVSLYVNADGSIGATANGADLGLVEAAGTVSATDTFLWVPSCDDDTGATVGASVSWELITSAASITEPVPAGSVDSCGNAIP